MSMQRRKFTKEFKIQIICEIDNGTPVAQLSRQHQICNYAMPPDISWENYFYYRKLLLSIEL